MEFRKILALRGPNIWANSQVIEAWLDLGAWNDLASNEIPGFNERLQGWLPSLVEHRCSIGERGGFFERLRRGTYLAHILEHVVLELQTLAGAEVGYGRTRPSHEHAVYKVVFKYKEETLARRCLRAALELVSAAVENTPFDIAATLSELRDTAERYMLGPSTNAIVEAAKARGIPHFRLNRNSLVQLGYGSAQRRIQAAASDRTGAIGEDIAQDKELTRQLLQLVGVPVPEGRLVSDAEDAWEAAEDIGVPVVVKPLDGNQGRGVATHLTTKEQVVAAYQAAADESDSIIVEKHAYGDDHRLLVVNNQLVAAARREPAHVIGDGVKTIRELVAIANLDPRRGEHHANVLSKIKIDAVAMNVLTDQGLTPDSVPSDGRKVLIRRNANLSTGGTATDVTDIVHPEVAARAVDAARVIGLDIAGVDILATDITQPLEQQGGIIVEVNAAPGLRMHLAPSSGQPRPVGEAIVDMLFAAGSNARIPIAAVTGINGKTTVTRFIAHMLKGAGHRVGMTCTDGIYIDGRRIDADDCAGPSSARSVLMNPGVDAAVLETARGGILRAGLGFDRCDVAVVTNIGDGDHLGLDDVTTPEELAHVKRTIVDVVRESGSAVLNATDPLVAEMAGRSRGGVLFFAIDGNHPVITHHRASGGRAAFVRDGAIILAEGSHEQLLTPLAQVPITHNGRIPFEVENTLAGAGAAWTLGVSLETMRAQAASFMPDMRISPGRFNLLEIKGATVIVDYGHNPHAVRAVVQAVSTFPHARRTVVFSAPGDRRDSDMVVMGELLGNAFDRVILYEGSYTRGREPGEIIKLLQEGLARATRVGKVESVQGAVTSVELALDTVAPGELLLIQADAIDETMEFFDRYLGGKTSTAGE